MLFNFRVDNVRVFQWVSTNLNMTFGQAYANQCWEFATGSPQNRKSATAEQTFSLRICDTQI